MQSSQLSLKSAHSWIWPWPFKRQRAAGSISEGKWWNLGLSNRRSPKPLDPPPHCPMPPGLKLSFHGRATQRFSKDTTLEVLTTRLSRREGHRQWPDEVKARTVSESLRPDVTVNEGAGRHGLKTNHLSCWRTMARQGKLVLPEPGDAVEFAAMVVKTHVPESPRARAVSRTEIVVGPVTILLEGASSARIAALARALAAAA